MRKLLAFVLLFTSFAVALERQSNQDYRTRRQKLAQKADGGIVLLFGATEASTGDAIWGFHQDADFYYLSGVTAPGAALLIAPEDKGNQRHAAHPYTEILFLPARNQVQEKWTGPKLGPEDANVGQITGFDQVMPLDRMPAEVAKFLPGRVYALKPAYAETSPAYNVVHWIEAANLAPGASMQDLEPMIASLRTIKDAGEVALIRKATDASVAAHVAAMKAVKPGSTEHQIAALMQYEFERRGCERPAYAPIVGTGFNSTVLHHSADPVAIQAGDTVVIDVGGEYSMYATDITRTLPAGGHFTARQREIYDIVLGAQQAAINAFQSGKSRIGGNSPDSLYKAAFDYINTHGKDLHGQPLGQYFIHGLSHFVGLDVHDDNDYNQPLGPGMVFTIEPGIYMPEEKLGVRIEDTFWVDPSGKLVNLSEALPKTADDVERVMAGK
jgi:Xaa-Pro aminopeptidase